MGELTKKCLGLIPTLTSHVNGLITFLAEASTKDHASTVSPRSSLVKSLTALAELLDLMSRISPEHIAIDHRRQCIAGLIHAVKLVHGLDHEDFAIIGIFFGVRN